MHTCVQDLDEYLRHVVKPAGRRGCPDVEAVRKRLRDFDFSAANVKLVGCVPGSHKGSDMERCVRLVVWMRGRASVWMRGRVSLCLCVRVRVCM